VKTLLAFFLFAFNILYAQQITCDTNSCVKKKAGSYQIELVKKCSTHLNVYVNDQKGKPLLNVPLIGYIDFFYNDGTFVIEELYQYPQTNYMEAEIPRAGFYNCKVTLIINNQTVAAYFDNECIHRALGDTENK
jgi:hypothetical protein